MSEANETKEPERRICAGYKKTCTEPAGASGLCRNCYGRKYYAEHAGKSVKPRPRPIIMRGAKPAAARKATSSVVPVVAACFLALSEEQLNKLILSFPLDARVKAATALLAGKL